MNHKRKTKRLLPSRARRQQPPFVINQFTKGSGSTYSKLELNSLYKKGFTCRQVPPVYFFREERQQKGLSFFQT